MATLTIVVFMGLPIYTIALRLFSGPGETWQHLVDHVLFDYLLNSFWLLLGCILLTLAMGVSAAWIVSRYRLFGHKWLEWLLILPLAFPSYITAYAYAGFFDYGGTLMRITQVLGLGSLRIDIMNVPGLIFVLSVSLFPYVYVASRAVFVYQSGRLIEASKLLGANEAKTFFKIVLPMARPGIIAGLVLVIMEVLNDYGAAKYYGVSTFTTGIFRAWFALEEPATAIYLSAILLLIVFAFIFLERWQRGNKSYELASKSKIRLPQIEATKSIRFIFLLLVFLPILFGFLLPVLQLGYWSILTFDKVASTEFFTTALQSLGIALLTALFTVLVALMTLYFPVWNRLKFLKKSGSLAILGYAVPGAVLAIGVMIPTLQLDRWFISIGERLFNMELGLLLNGTLSVLLYAYIIRFLAVAANPVLSNQLKLKKSFSDASRLLGRGPFKTFLAIDLPLLKPSLLAAFILVFVDTMKELPLTLILKPYDFNTLAVKAYEYASDEQIMEASLPALCIVLTGVVPIILLNRFILNDKHN
ncbi:ABC transporter permease [Maribacter chungangensis]|uniref:ABC transporter permease n=1 Tax=Maribacter chungangensis TaxID=1069117 RepID=A0ABW3B4D2_9FLAO